MKKGKTSTATGGSLLGDYLGKDVAELVAELAKQNDYSEFKLAEALGKEVNQTRNMLYKLHDASLASFIKKKDNKIGWYIYYWTFHPEKVNHYMLKERKNKLETIKDIASRRQGQNYFSCKSWCVSLDFDKAFEFSFRCPECGELLEQEAEDKKRFGSPDDIDKLEREIRGMEKSEETDRRHDKEANELLENKELEEKNAKKTKKPATAAVVNSPVVKKAKV